VQDVRHQEPSVKHRLGAARRRRLELSEYVMGERPIVIARSVGASTCDRKTFYHDEMVALQEEVYAERARHSGQFRNGSRKNLPQ
jgi:hypothetical protein